ncbi:MAG: argininosuccinate lyase [Acidiferrobacterales bacterium]
MATDKPWGGRFSESTDSVVESFTASVDFDRRLYPYDIAGSIAHARMLAQIDILTEKECDAIISGLEAIKAEIDTGQFAWLIELEDVHMNIEVRLIDRIGEVGKKLHTGRSRNDQVATDLRLYLRDAVDALCQALRQLQQTLVDIAEREVETVMPGFTHLQVAQPVTFGHHMMAWFEMLQRDHARLQDCRRRINVMPLGAGALAGTSYPIDREYTAKLLGFDAVAENSLDAVSDRDFAIEFGAVVALLMMHLSRFCEELVLWTANAFDFVELGDAFCTGSSMMPQKKNPDVAELIRAKSARVNGNVVALLTLMKAQPLAYNRDNQEDKHPLFDTVDTSIASLEVFTGLIGSMKPKRDAMLEAAKWGFPTATDLADYLVRKGIAFRDAHEVVGKIVAHALDTGTDLSGLGLEELRKFCKYIDDDVHDVLTLNGSVSARDHLGGTAPAQVRKAIARARRQLAGASKD